MSELSIRLREMDRICPQFAFDGPRRDTMMRRVFVEEVGGEWQDEKRFILSDIDETLFQLWKVGERKIVKVDPLAAFENECQQLDW